MCAGTDFLGIALGVSRPGTDAILLARDTHGLPRAADLVGNLLHRQSLGDVLLPQPCLVVELVIEAARHGHQSIGFALSAIIVGHARPLHYVNIPKGWRQLGKFPLAQKSS